MQNLLYIISFFWLIRTLKVVLFWIYLWQLKEYHVGRFIDHFRTHKGKKIFFNFLLLFKIIILTLLLANLTLAVYFLLFLYVAEFLFFVTKRFKRPVWTFKTLFLTAASFFIAFLYLIWFQKPTALLIFDIASPFLFSAVVLVFQPFFVMKRNNILEEAKEKVKKYLSAQAGKNLTVIGITGSYGKTSTKEFLKTILSLKFNVLATPEHKNSEIGIAQTILKDLNENHQVFIVEMGAYNKGGINLLCDIVRPKIGIVTGVNEQHLATFGSMENLLSAEGGRELLNNLQKDGLIVLNGNNKYCLDLYKNMGKSYLTVTKKIFTVDHNKISSDIWTEDVEVKKESLDFVAVAKDKEMAHFKVDVLGKQNIQNLLGAILVAKELGMNLEEISRACKNIKQGQAGIILKNGIHGIEIINSSHSSNPDGVMADLDYLKVFEGKKVIVMPCLIELGKKSAEIHREIGKKIAEISDMAIITTKDKFEEIKNSAVLNGMPKEKILFQDRPKEIFNMINTFCKEEDAVLFEGRVPEGLIKLLIG